MKVKILSLKNVVGASLVAVASSSHAALPTDAQAAVDSVSTMGTDFVAAAWGIAIVVVAGFAGIKLFKKAINKAT
ncbi:phage coat protein [Vibrio sp. AK197]